MNELILEACNPKISKKGEGEKKGFGGNQNRVGKKLEKMLVGLEKAQEIAYIKARPKKEDLYKESESEDEPN